MYVVDISNEERLEENYETIRKLQHHRGTASKPFLIVLNKRKPTELDEFDFTIGADLNAVGMQHGQMIFITHVHEYKGELDNAKQPPPPVSKRSRRVRSPLLIQFCVFVDKIIEHYVFLSEGVQSAEMALKLRQQAERDERRIRLMHQEQDRKNSEIAELEGRHASSNGDVPRTKTTQGNREMPQIQENPTSAERESKDNAQKRDSPLVPDTQPPVADIPSQPPSKLSDVPSTSAGQLAQNHPPASQPYRTKTTPANALHDESVFVIKRPLSLSSSELAGRERHTKRMRRIQEGLRMRAEVIHLEQL
ncbi:ADP-ribosylation factor [Parelaphostrongylus tenuis]|uniref:ADP-ribosylation factor n=1 Tax=Parelaphostrongylus tenuis TaxID=148309 RepID=A0AAD5LYE7_PARTN|nr:ADP-ribosylation factor [Parelaphostrongylus tenuis]